MKYRCVATSLKGFVYQIAVGLMPRPKNYHWFAQGTIPEDKIPEDVDEKIIRKYRIDISESTRHRYKEKGIASVQYVRFGRDFVLMATKGRHKLKECEQLSWVEETPIRIANYSISRRKEGLTKKGNDRPKYRSHVQIDWDHYLELKAMFSSFACRRSVSELVHLFYTLPFEPYAPVKRQVAGLREMVNRQRRRKGLGIVPKESFLFRRPKSVEVFEPNTVLQLWSPLGKWWYEVRRPQAEREAA